MKTCLAALLAVVTLVLQLPAAESYQPESHVTRGIYAHIHSAMQGSVWSPWGDGFTFADEGAHGGRSCVRCVGKAGTREQGISQGVSQAIALNQAQPKPVKIAGWSKCQGVPGPRDYRYSLYVDLTLADGTSWPMKLATFPPGTHDWQYAETVVTPPQPIRSARFHAFLRERDGTVWFDDLFFGETDGPNLLKCPGFEQEAYHLRPDGHWQPWDGAWGPELRLGAQEALVARLTNTN